MRIIQLSAATVIAIHLAAGTSFGQEQRPERPYRGIFGGGGGRPNAEESLTVSGSAGAGYDTNVLADASDAGIGGPGISDPRVSGSGSYALLTGAVNYVRSKPRVSFGASVDSSARYYPTRDAGYVASYDGSGVVTWTPA